MIFPTTKYSFSKALFWCWRAIKTVGFQEQQLKISHDYKCKHQPQPSMLVLQISLMPSRMPYGTFLRMLRPWLQRLICVGCSRPVAVIGGYVKPGIFKCRAGLAPSWTPIKHLLKSSSQGRRKARRKAGSLTAKTAGAKHISSETKNQCIAALVFVFEQCLPSGSNKVFITSLLSIAIEY